MKNRLLMLLCLTFFWVSCDPYKKMISSTNFPSPFKFTLVDTVTGTKEQLYVKAHEWMAKSFNNSKSVIQMQDKEAGKLIGKAVIPVMGTVNGYGQQFGEDYVNYTISIDIKDGRYRCVLSDFDHAGGQYKYAETFGSLDQQNINSSSSVNSTTRWESIKSIAMSRSKLLLSDLERKMEDNSGDDF